MRWPRSDRNPRFVVTATIVFRGKPVVKEISIAQAPLRLRIDDLPEKVGPARFHGIPDALLRAIRPRQLLRFFSDEWLPQHERAFVRAGRRRWLLARHGFPRPESVERRRRLPAVLPELQVAALYVSRIGKSPSPALDVADTFGIEGDRARDLLRRARQRGLLTAASHRRAGGRLTKKALRLLRAGS